MIEKLNGILEGMLTGLGTTFGYILVIGIIGYIVFRLMKAVPLVGLAIALAVLAYLSKAIDDPMMILNDLKAMG